jgi:Gluconate 2-dehydrogenase subunit 3
MDTNSKIPVLNNSPRGGISRREMVQRLFGGAGAVAALPGVLAAHPIHKHLADASVVAAADEKAAAASWAPEFLDAHQNETLIVLAERIVPGSSKAQVNRFVDLLLTVDTPENQKKFLAALSAFEAEALNRHRHPFKDLTEAQQNEILTAASTEKPAHGRGRGDWIARAAGSGEESFDTLGDYFENLKGWVSGAYYSSEIGMRELGWTGNNFFESFPGCQHPEGHH